MCQSLPIHLAGANAQPDSAAAGATHSLLTQHLQWGLDRDGS